MLTLTIPKGYRILVAGASGDLGFSLAEMLSGEEVRIGAHCFRNGARLEALRATKPPAQIRIFKGAVEDKMGAIALVDEFIAWAGGIDAVVQLSGAVHDPKPWDELDQASWDRDLAVNLSGPFFLAQAAMNAMKSNGGKVVLVSTASAAHGGGGNSLAYGAAKAGIECLTKGLARQGAKYGIGVNCVAPGFIDTKFHIGQMRRTAEQLAERMKLVPLRRAGRPDEVAGLVAFLLSTSGDYITGETVAISGGDWL